MSQNHPCPPKRIYILTHPRSASNLLLRVLSLPDQPTLHQHPPSRRDGNFFLPLGILKLSRGLVGLPYSHWSESDRTAIADCERECERLFRAFVDDAKRAGKRVVVKEHVEFLRRADVVAMEMEPGTAEKWEGLGLGYGTNPSLLPFPFLSTWQPVFLIRHPALAFPSRVRAMRDLGELGPLEDGGAARERVLTSCLTLRWTRALFDWYRERADASANPDLGSREGWQPIILDADDIMREPRTVVGKFCELVGLDSARLKFSWAKTADGEECQRQGGMEKRMMSTLWGSEGVVEGKTAVSLDVEVEARKWMEEFGEDEGRTVERLVRAAMPDYEYMKALRLKAGD